MMEKAKEELLLEKLRDTPKPFVLQSETVPAVGFGVTRASKLPRYLHKMSSKKTSFVEDDDASGDLVAFGSKTLSRPEPVLLSLPRSSYKPQPDTPFTELNSTSTI